MEKPKILYVDDEPVNLMLLKAHLEKKYDILTAGDGPSALDVIAANRGLKIVISDMRMPHMNGVDFISEAVKSAPHIHYYILTGFDISPEIQQALDQGLIRRYFKKPFRSSEMITEFDGLLKE
ncbi:MAG: response regulator [Bacteroidales bacterium]|nr:response regulator [Bacteroidales bacterium]